MTSTKNDQIFVKLSPVELYLYKKDKDNAKVKELVQTFLNVHPDGKIFLCDSYGNVIKYEDTKNGLV